MSEDENGHDVKRFVTKRLSWEGLTLRELKDVLDLAYKRSLSPRLRKLQTERVVGVSEGFSTLRSKMCCSFFTAGHKYTCAGKMKLIMKLTKGAVTNVTCFVQLVSQCFGDIVAGQVHETFHRVTYPATAKIVARQVARAVAESRIKFYFRATCLATILAVAGYVTL